MNLGSKKDLRVSGVELRRCSCKAFFSFPIKVLFLKLTVNKEKGGGNEHTWRAQYNKELYAAFGKNESLLKKKRESIDFIIQSDNIVGARIYFTGEVSGSSPG